MPSVLLATFNLMPEGEPGGAALLEALAARGVEARWARWDDPEVAWDDADLVAARSTWDYHRRLPEFLGWAREVGRSARLLNGAELFAWNADKAYLLELAAHAPVVPTGLLDDRSLVPGLRAALERWGSVVVKPRLGASGIGVVVADSLADPRLEGLVAGPWTVQPLVASVRTEGESSVYVFDGRAVAQVDKRPAEQEVRVHELYGGSSRPVPLDPSRARVAEGAVAVAEDLRGTALDYARVDLMKWQGGWVVSELELIEPGLHLDIAPGIAEPFADLVTGLLR